MSESEDLKRARAMAAKGRKNYSKLKTEVEARVVRWEWASFPRHSYEPAYFEINKFPRGKVLAYEKDAPLPPYQCGYDTQGRMIVERQYTEFPGHVGETFYVHEPDGIMEIIYDSYTPKKTCQAVIGFSVHEGRVVDHRYISTRDDGVVTTYQYDDLGQMVRSECRGKDGLGMDIHHWYELEYDAKGRIVRIHWCYPDGRRYLHFERPNRQTTLKALKRPLLEGLTKAIIDAIARTGVTDEVYVVAFRYFHSHDDKLPPLVSINTVPERERLMQAGGEHSLESIWNPCEWRSEWQELDVKLSPELEAMCASANQDIWQNEREEQALRFYFELVQALAKEPSFPLRYTDELVNVVLVPEVGDHVQQVAQQLNATWRKKLRKGGWLPG